MKTNLKHDYEWQQKYVDANAGNHAAGAAAAYLLKMKLKNVKGGLANMTTSSEVIDAEFEVIK